MKLKRIIVVLIATLLNCSISYCQSNDTISSSTGNLIKSDTTITITIDNIRKVNNKLLEAKYCKSISQQQEYIIVDQSRYIHIQDSVIKDLQNRIVKETELNVKLREDYRRQRNKSIIIGSVTGVAVIVVTGILLGVIKK